jgi:hypothetical protein
MSRRIRRTLATTGLMAALFLALPAPSRAVGPWEPGASARLSVKVWSWLESLGFAPRQPAAASRRPVSVREKQGPMIDPNGGNSITVPMPPTGSEQGSGIDPNGGR